MICKERNFTEDVRVFNKWQSVGYFLEKEHLMLPRQWDGCKYKFTFKFTVTTSHTRTIAQMYTLELLYFFEEYPRIIKMNALVTQVINEVIDKLKWQNSCLCYSMYLRMFFGQLIYIHHITLIFLLILKKRMFKKQSVDLVLF